MKTHRINYEFSGMVWKYPGKGGWCFVSLPLEMSTEIRDLFKQMEEGWGRLQVKACVADLEWDTAIWFDSKQKTYLLPLKAVIRSKAGIKEGDELLFVLSL